MVDQDQTVPVSCHQYQKGLIPFDRLDLNGDQYRLSNEQAL